MTKKEILQLKDKTLIFTYPAYCGNTSLSTIRVRVQEIHPEIGITLVEADKDNPKKIYCLNYESKTTIAKPKKTKLQWEYMIHAIVTGYFDYMNYPVTHEDIAGAPSCGFSS